MTFANVGTLGVTPGNIDAVVAILTRRNPQLNDAGCLLYEVGTSADSPDTVFVAELWESADAHQASLSLDSVQAAIAEARPYLSGEMSGFRFDVAGSPLRD
ncbi:putative quinol monooxygenase [Parenemella sanctibonifatiensis]|uniref:Antibiotic biosynthesis monooxygenase n=1 Tax=Parenemella sanctibonifatiensis TaxID=2016505 RepID=A0A255E444_9ACTN|nr:putative quinol monooxygenase [Parenemella sanctibonifatiensis]OYN86348.1 antibiotic biosynthesis monooxygenase [Parenemella sanctibonifatiensis]